MSKQINKIFKDNKLNANKFIDLITNYLTLDGRIDKPFDNLDFVVKKNGIEFVATKKQVDKFHFSYEKIKRVIELEKEKK